MERMILQEEFTQLVDEKLAVKGWTRAELARQMGVPRQFVTNYLNGRNSAGPDVMEKFFAALGFRPHLSLEELPRTRSTKGLPAAG